MWHLQRFSQSLVFRTPFTVFSFEISKYDVAFRLNSMSSRFSILLFRDVFGVYGMSFAFPVLTKTDISNTNEVFVTLSVPTILRIDE